MQKLLDRVRHLIQNHIIDTEIDSTLQKRRYNENIQSSYFLFTSFQSIPSANERIIASRIDCGYWLWIPQQWNCSCFRLVTRPWMASTLFTKISTGGEPIIRNTFSKHAYRLMCHSTQTNRSALDTAMDLTWMFGLSLPCKVRSPFVLTVIGSSTQLLINRWTHIGKVAEQS